jgi:CheY-like chemotaxis protein
MKQRILVVDDDPQYRDLLKTWLESEGREAILAETLEEGFVGIGTEPLPDVVLLDIHLGIRVASPSFTGHASKGISLTCRLPL